MITKNDLIRGWNSAGSTLNAEFLGLVFKKLETPEDVAVHNFIMSQINERLGPHGGDFTKQVADLIEQLSLRNLENGTQTQESKKG